jgi:hypothetical protein
MKRFITTFVILGALVFPLVSFAVDEIKLPPGGKGYDFDFRSSPSPDDLYKAPSPEDLEPAPKSVLGAGCSNDFKTFADILNFGSCVINSALVQIAISFAVVYFIWGVVQYVLNADNVEERKKSKQVMLWGIIAIFVIISVWGIINFFRTTLGV